MEYRREVDGLRAIAVLPVILFHADFELFSGGYVGVDVFFVISGYLITLVIISDLEKQKFTIRKFYERRARRILPALFFVMLCCIPFAWIWMLPSQIEDFAQALIAISFFSSNILFWRKDDYFAPEAEENPLLHTWSLAVEEQFYIFFPILLLLLWRFGRNPIFYVVLALSALSLLLSEWGWRYSSSANFYLLPTRAWELGAGAICALLMHGKSQHENALLSGLGLFLILFSIFYYDETTPFPSLYTLAPVGGTALIIFYGASSTWVARFLSFPAFVGVGLISYSAYLWHQPLFAFARIKYFTPPPEEVMMILSFVSLGLAYFTWRYVEQPFRRKSLPLLPTRTGLFSTSGTVSFAFVSIGMYGVFTDGLYNLWIKNNPDSSHTYQIVKDIRYITKNGPGSQECRFNSSDFSRTVEKQLISCYEKHGPGTAVLGDSHGIDIYNGMHFHYEGEFLFGYTRGGCHPYTQEDWCQYEKITDFMERNPEVFSKLFYSQAGFFLLESDKEKSDRTMFSHVPITDPLDPDQFLINDRLIDYVLNYLENFTEVSRVVWIGPRLEPHIGKEYIVAKGCDHNYSLREGQYDVFKKLDNRIHAMAEDKEVYYVSQIDEVQFNIEKDLVNCDQIYWQDGDHWSLSGASLFVGRMIDKLK
ncbi:acyltransferase family protein [Halomonas vilamensis]|uniref:Acyltransferase family protein n=1 Tax=Vreelandella vilamensis TaxID=531309 RepID=A0ABU1H5H0_9GAMM|nr:acyltransferase family protein [Halomonas vilamensis]MDR5899551.1 acyltransferase family protein [Halomonas vilamensis]